MQLVIRSFQVEASADICMQSICHVMESVLAAKQAPLLLVDELATSTSTTDGGAIAWAVAEELVASKACTIFATHFIELEHLAHMYPSAFTSHMSSEDKEGEYVLTHQVGNRSTAFECELEHKIKVFLPVVRTGDMHREPVWSEAGG